MICQVNLTWYEGQEKVDISDYINSGTWDIIACPGNFEYEYDTVEGLHTAQIIFTLVIRRKTLVRRTFADHCTAKCL